MIKIDIKNNGYHHFKKNLFNLDVKIAEEFEEIYLKNLKLRADENVATIDSINNLKKYPKLKNIHDQIVEVLNFNKLNHLEFDDLWLVKSTVDKFRHDKLPFVPHIDKSRKLKVMIYLNTVNIDSGPIYISKLNPNEYENFRKKLKKNYKIKQENQVKELDIRKFTPITGDFGSTIFFDTNTPHFAGKIKDNSSQRKVLRFNFVKKKNYINKFINFIHQLNKKN